MKYGRFAIVAVMLLFVSTALAQPSGAGAIAALHNVTADADTTPAPDAPTVVTTPDAVAAPIVEDAVADVQPATVTDATGETSEEPEPTVGQLVEQGKDVYSVWKTQGWIAGLTALIYLLIQITKVGFIKSLLGVRKWLRPLIALVLGLTGATFASMAGGVVWWNALLGGIGAALGSSGFNELMNTTTAAGRAKSTGTSPGK